MNLSFSSEHVKDILRESYGEELEEWWQKEKKSEPQSNDVETKLEKKDKPGEIQPSNTIMDGFHVTGGPYWRAETIRNVLI